jgi:protein-S-isoprenylcysteine O-methyltransferase Ste14/pimeloyl-ACP methyl ester carboxylesterase
MLRLSRMMMMIRAVLAFVALPGLIAYAIPLFVLPRNGAWFWPALGPLVAGTVLLLWCVREFLVVGKGTLAPWDPPRALVSSGLYAITRNPMYLAVSLVLAGWAMAFLSAAHLAYAVIVMVLFHVRVVFFEEPWLSRTHRKEWLAYSAAVPRWLFRSRRAVWIAWLAAVVAVVVAGVAYEIVAEARAAREFTPPGTFVDIGGRRLHLLCEGTGQPTVFLESSGWGSAVSSARVRKRLVSSTRVCSYDRSGNGWSDPGPGVVSALDLARDLAVLQDRGNVSWPFVIVAASVGGLTGEMYARQFPERTAGLVMVDAANSYALPLLDHYSGRATATLCATSVLARFGVVRLADPFALSKQADGRLAASLAYGPGPWSELCAIARGFAETKRAFANARPLAADLPLTVLSAASDVDLMPAVLRRRMDTASLLAAFQDSHRQLSRQSTHGSWQLVPDSTHLIGESQPDAVVDAVMTIVRGLR